METLESILTYEVNGFIANLKEGALQETVIESLFKERIKDIIKKEVEEELKGK